jgi:putative intracellular protease/amidase
MDNISIGYENKVAEPNKPYPPTILMPLPDSGFDPTEAAIPWGRCHTQGWNVVISTENGAVPCADNHKLSGPLPGIISAGAAAKSAYEQMSSDASFKAPISFADISASEYDAVILPGGDALPMHQYLENTVLQGKVLDFWKRGKLLAAICHGVLVLARTIDPQTGKSVLFGHKVMAPPKSLDRLGYRLDSLIWKHGYIMYTRCVEDEVRGCLERETDLVKGPGFFTPYALVDRNLITARWYMDAVEFGDQFVKVLKQRLVLKQFA